MTSIRLSKAVALSLLISSAVFADIHDRIEYKLSRVLKDLDIIINGDTSLCTPINQLEIDQGGGSYLISASGLYCLTEDAVGTVIIDSGVDCVRIDLQSHTLDAGGADNAIVGGGSQGLAVFNGCITNSADAAISLTAYSAVELYNLHVHDYLLDGIRITDSSLISVHDVNFNNEDAEERAALFDGVDSLAVSRCNASGFLSTVGAIFEFSNSTNVSVQDVNVTNNTKTLADPVSAGFGYFGDVAPRLVSLDACSNFDLTRVNVNNNVGDNAQTANYFAAIGATQSSNGVVNQCQTNANVLDNGGTFGAGGLIIYTSQDIAVNGHQANGNSVSIPTTGFIAIGGFLSNNIIVDGVQTNDNSVAELIPTSGGAPLCGVSLGFLGVGCAIRNSQSNNNRAGLGGVPASGAETTFCVGYSLFVDVIENCEAINNSMGSSNPFNWVAGLHSHSGDIVNCVFNANNGGERAIGIWKDSFIPDFDFDGSDYKIINSTANANDGYGFLAESPFLSGAGLHDRAQFINSTFNINGRANGDAAGIAFTPLEDEQTWDIVIKGCVISDNFSAGGNAAGITITDARNVVIEDTIVDHTGAEGDAHGILFDSVEASQVIRTQLIENQDSGIELVGVNDSVALIECVAMYNNIGFDFVASSTATCCLVQDCRAISNLEAGFVHATAPLTSSFIGNEAHCNGDDVEDNYVINGGGISLQDLEWPTGDLTIISGNAALGARFTNIRGIAFLP